MAKRRSLWVNSNSPCSVIHRSRQHNSNNICYSSVIAIRVIGEYKSLCFYLCLVAQERCFYSVENISHKWGNNACFYNSTKGRMPMGALGTTQDVPTTSDPYLIEWPTYKRP